MFDKKLDTDPYLDRLSETYPELYEGILLEFLKRPETRVALTRHEKTPTEILRKIASDNGAPIGNILSNPNCPTEIIAATLKSGKDDDLLAIAQNSAIDDSVIRQLAESSYSPVFTWICRRPDCPADLLESFFAICEKEWQSAAKRVQEETDANNSANIIFGDDVFGEIDDFAMYYEIDEYLLEAIASNPNTPKRVFDKMMKMELHKGWFGGGSLGSTLLSNPSVSAEDRAYLNLQGITKHIDNSGRVSSMIEHYGLPTSQAFDYSKFPLKYLEALNELGHPSGLLHPNLPVADQHYDFNECVDSWIKYETIYRTFWPELAIREDIFFWYQRSSYDGDNFYFSIPGVELEHEFSRGSYTYNSMTYPFIDRPWAVTVEDMDIEMSHENFSYRDIEELFDYSDEGEQYDLILAAIVSKNSWAGEETHWSSNDAEKKVVVSALYTLTKKGEEFVCEWAESLFEDDRDMKINIIPEKALPYSWKAMRIEKKNQITQTILEGFNKKVDSKYQYAEHFLTCIALHPDTPETIKDVLKTVDSKPVQQALAVSPRKDVSS
jgi:hypothetical protein